MKPVGLIYLVLSRPPGYSETFIKSKISGLQEQGVAVRLFVDHRDPSFSLCGQTVLPRPGTLWGTLQLLRVFFLYPHRTTRFFRAEFRKGKRALTAFKNFAISLHLLSAARPDCIHFGFATMAIGRDSAAFALETEMSVSLRGFDISRHPINHPKAYIYVWPSLTRIHSISKALLQKAYQLGLPAGTASTLIAPAIDTTYFNGNRPEFAMPQPVRILTVARLHWSKGLEYTLQALALLKKRGVSFTYTLAGDGPDYERLVLAAHQLELQELVNFAGKVEHAALRGFYQQHDLYVQYSVQEGFCNAVLEAQAMEMPCVVSDAEGLPENVLNGQTGWVVPRRNPEALADAIQSVIAMPGPELKKICRQASGRVHREFDVAQQAHKFFEFFKPAFGTDQK